MSSGCCGASKRFVMISERSARCQRQVCIYRDLCGVGGFGCLGEGGRAREVRDAALRLLRGLEAALHVCRELAVSRSSPVSKCFVTRFGRAG